MTSLFLFALSLLPIQLPQMNAEPGTVYSSPVNAVTVVEAYFNTCPYCNYNAPNVDELADEYRSNDRVQVLDVGIDRKDSDYQSWINKHKPNHPVLKDSSRILINQLGTKSYPSTYVIGCDGQVLMKTSGQWSQSTKRKIRDAVEAALKVDCD